jgi:hypothetical protein
MADALERFRKILGRDWVFSGNAVASYHDPYTISNDEGRYKFGYALVEPGVSYSICTSTSRNAGSSRARARRLLEFAVSRAFRKAAAENGVREIGTRFGE